MTDREIMQQALEALQTSVPTHDGFLSHCKAMNHLRIRLAQPEQEPVAWLSTDSIGERYLGFDKPLDNDPVQPLYTTPPQRPWVDLTPKEIESCRQQGYAHGGLNAPFDFDKAAGALLAKAKEKNT